GEGLVGKRVIGIEQLQQTAILAEYGVDEEDGLLLHRLRQLIVISREFAAIGAEGNAKLLKAKPLDREVFGHRPRARILQHPPRLLPEDLRLMKFARAGEGEELVIRHARPEKVGQSRGENEIIDAINPLFLRLGLNQKKKVRRDQH